MVLLADGSVGSLEHYIGKGPDSLQLLTRNVQGASQLFTAVQDGQEVIVEMVYSGKKIL